jgi:hypothetical protein
MQHVFTTDASGKWVLMVDPDRARLLRDASWSVGKMHQRSKLLQARATTAAPGIKVGARLHQQVRRLRKKGNCIRAKSRNYLDARRENLAIITIADRCIFSRARRSTQAIGVERPGKPAFFRSHLRPFHARIYVRGENLSLSWWGTLEEAQCAYDAAAMMVHGSNTSTNVSIGLLDAEVAKTEACKLAAKTARRIICEHRSGELAKRYEALKKAKTYAEKMAVWTGIRAVGKPIPGPRVVMDAAAR